MSSEVDLIRTELGMVANKELVEALEEQLKTDAELMKEAVLIIQTTIFEKVIRTMIETFKDKLVCESLGRESDLLNRGAISGIASVLATMKQVAIDYEAMHAKPKELTREEQFQIL